MWIACLKTSERGIIFRDFLLNITVDILLRGITIIQNFTKKQHKKHIIFKLLQGNLWDMGVSKYRGENPPKWMMIWGCKNPYFWVFPPICLFASFLPPQTKPRIPRKKTLGSSEPFVEKKQVQLKRSPPRRNGWLGEGVGWCLCGGGRLKIKLWVYIYI